MSTRWGKEEVKKKKGKTGRRKAVNKSPIKEKNVKLIERLSETSP